MHIQRSVGAVALGLLLFPVCLFGQIFTSPVKNALVPATAPIQPPQAFVNCLQTDFGSALLDVDLVDWHNKGITSISSTYVSNLDILHGAANSPTGLKINLSGNAIPSAQVTSIVGALVTNANTGGTLNISGGTNGAPTPIILKIQFPNIDYATLGAGGESFGSVGNGNDRMFFCEKIAVANTDPPLSSDGGHICTGIANDPVTRQQIINAMIVNGQGHVVDNGDGSINLTVTNGTFYPYDLTDAGTGISATVIQSGNPGAQSVGTLVNIRGWTVTTN